MQAHTVYTYCLKEEEEEEVEEEEQEEEEEEEEEEDCRPILHSKNHNSPEVLVYL